MITQSYLVQRKKPGDTGWEDAVGQLLTADKDGKFYSVTLNGNFTGFQFLDYADPSKNTAGQGFVTL